jgi:hypothetical protein
LANAKKKVPPRAPKARGAERALRFDDQTREDLKRKFTIAFAKANAKWSRASVELEGEIFIGTLEGYASGIPPFKTVRPPEQKRRREKVRSLANTLEKLHQTLTKIDSAALGFAVWRGMQEVETKKLGANPFLSGWPAILLASRLRDECLPLLAAFSDGVRSAHKGLPLHDFNFMLESAIAVERIFRQNRLSFTVNDSGFAAQCLRAIFMLGGLNDSRVDYWLTKARDSEEALVKRLENRQKSADK